MRVVLLVLLVGMLIPVPQAVFGQCGDADNDGSMSIPDVVYLVGYLAAGGPAPPDSTKADMDDRYGITVSDLFMLIDEMFVGGAPLDCNIDKDYYYACSPSDTVSIPFKYVIPDAITDMYLPVVADWHNSTRAYYITITPDGVGSNGTFQFQNVVNVSRSAQVYRAGPDVTFMGGYPTPITSGTEILGVLHYTRIASGTGEIVATYKDKSPFLRSAIEKNDYNLHRPIFIYKFPDGDLNCDTNVDISDLTYLVDWMFKGGPAPCDPYDGP